MCGKLRILAGHLETRFASRLSSSPVRIRQKSANKRATSAARIFLLAERIPFLRVNGFGGDNRDTHVRAVTREKGRKRILENDNSPCDDSKRIYVHIYDANIISVARNARY